MISKIRSWFRKPQEKLPFNPKVKANFVVEPRGKEASIRRHVEDAAKILQNEGFKSIKTTSFGTEVAGNLNQVRDAMRQIGADLSAKDIPRASMRVELNLQNAV